MTNKTTENNYKANVPTAGLIGVICGDVMGLPYEFRGTRTKDYHFEL